MILAAAKVGGIHANDSYPAEFIRDNLAVQTNVIDAAYRNGARKLTVPRVELHLPQARATADERGLPADADRSSRPTSGTRSPRSPASRCARRTGANTASTRSR